jgi:hypothetical protein
MPLLLLSFQVSQLLAIRWSLLPNAALMHAPASKRRLHLSVAEETDERRPDVPDMGRQE